MSVQEAYELFEKNRRIADYLGALYSSWTRLFTLGSLNRFAFIWGGATAIDLDSSSRKTGEYIDPLSL